MSLLGIFDIGKTAISAAQIGIGTASNNIANINTPGYSSQDVILSAGASINISGNPIGTGVNVTAVTRSYDTFITAQLFAQTQSRGGSSALEQSMSAIEQIFNDQNGLGLSSALNDFFDAWNSLASNPQGPAERAALLQKASTFVGRAKSMEDGLTGILGRIDDTLNVDISRVNKLADELAQLNEKIMKAEISMGSGTANTLRDQRDALLKELSGLAEISYYEGSDSTLTVTMGMMNLVSGIKSNDLSAGYDTSGNMRLYLDNVDITDGINKGEIGGYLSSAEYIRSGPLEDLRTLVASVVKEVNALHRQGYGLDGSTGSDFFNMQLSTSSQSAAASISTPVITDPSAMTLDDYTITFDALGNYYVNDVQTGSVVTSGAYDPLGTTIAFNGINVTITGAAASTDSFTIASPSDDIIDNLSVAITDSDAIAAASDAAALPGDNTNASAIADLWISEFPELGGESFSDYYKAMVAEVGVKSADAADTLEFDDNLLAEIGKRRDALCGVSLDEEATDLIKFQRFFQAGAKIIQTADELMQTVINMVQ